MRALYLGLENLAWIKFGSAAESIVTILGMQMHPLSLMYSCMWDGSERNEFAGKVYVLGFRQCNVTFCDMIVAI